MHKPIIRKSKNVKYTLFQGKVWGADLANMQIINKYHKGIRFLLCVTRIFSKYAWFVSLKDKKGNTITFTVLRFKISDKSKGHKPNKIWVNKGSEF